MNPVILSELQSDAQFSVLKVGDEKPVSELPEELWVKIFSFLEPEEMMTTCLVSRAWRDRTLEVGKSEGVQIVRFARTIIRELHPEDHSIQMAQLSQITTREDFSSAKNLKMVKKAILKYKKQFIVILKDLDHNHLIEIEGKLRKNYHLKFFKDITLAIQGYKHILLLSNPHYIIHNSISEERFAYLLINAINILASHKMIGFAVECLNTLNYGDPVKMLALTFLEIAIREKDVEGIIQLATFLFTQEQNGVYFHYPVHEFLKNNNFDMAIEVVKAIPVKEVKNNCLFVMIDALLEKAQVDQALDVANLFDEVINQHAAVWNIIKKLVYVYKVNIALEIVARESDENIRDKFYRRIAWCEAALENVDSALAIAKLIRNPEDREYCIRMMIQKKVSSKFIMKRDPISDKIKMTKATSNKNLQSVAMWQIFELALDYDISRANEVANEMPFEEVKNYAFTVIDRTERLRKEREGKSPLMEYFSAFKREMSSFFIEPY